MNEAEDGKGEKKRKYYQTRNEAESERNKGGRIYYIPNKGYYIVRLRKSFWEKLWE